MSSGRRAGLEVSSIYSGIADIQLPLCLAFCRESGVKEAFDKEVQISDVNLT